MIRSHKLAERTQPSTRRIGDSGARGESRTLDLRGDLGRLREELGPSNAFYKGRRDEMLILVHGYNNRRREALASFAEFEAYVQMAMDRGVIKNTFGFLWPGDWGIHTLTDAASFPSRVPVAVEAGRTLAEFIRSDRWFVGPCTFTIVAHSLGCRLVLEALAELATNPAPTNRIVRAVVLMAPAVPDAYFENLSLLREGPYREGRLLHGLSQTENVSVYFSKHDRILQVFFPPGQSRAEGLAAGRLPVAVGRRGWPRVGVWTTRHFTSYGHSNYWSSKVIARAVGQLMGKTVKGPAPAAPLPMREPAAANHVAQKPASSDRKVGDRSAA